MSALEWQIVGVVTGVTALFLLPAIMWGLRTERWRRFIEEHKDEL